MSDVAVAGITAAATLIGATIGVVAATFAQDRSRIHRENAMASALLGDVERINALLPLGEAIPFADPYGNQGAPSLHPLTEPVVVEMAGLDRGLFRLLLGLNPIMQARQWALVSYWSRSRDIDSRTSSVRQNEQTIAEPDGYRNLSYSSHEAAMQQLDAQKQNLSREIENLSADADVFWQADAAARALLADTAGRLTRVVERQVPRFPWPTSEELSPQRWNT